MSSDARVADAWVGLRDRPYLFGDWAGARTALAQHGIILDFSATQFCQGITSGGLAIGTDKFMNASIVLSLNLGRPVTGHSIPGVVILRTKGRDVEGALTVFNTKDYSTKFGVDHLFDRDATILGLRNFFYNIHGLPGYSSLIGIYNTRGFRSIDPASLIVIPGQGVSLGDVGGSWALTYMVKQTVDGPRRSSGMRGTYA